jgi:hypothetical protein
MTYTRAYTTWQDKPNLTTPVNAAILQNMEQGIYDAYVHHANNAIRYVAGTGVSGVSGSDSNDGLHPGKPYETVAAAYAALPSTGGNLIMLPGRHDLGSGFATTATKYVHMQSFTGRSHSRTSAAAVANQTAMPVLYGTGANLITLTGSGVTIQNGFSFKGIAFDMTHANNVGGIYAEDCNHVRVEDCCAEGPGSGPVQKNFLRSVHPVFDDLSWWRIHNNLTRNVGLCYLNETGSGNCNHNIISDNVCFGWNTATAFAITVNNAYRSNILNNNLEATNLGGIRLLGQSRYNHILWNGGEGLVTPYLQLSASSFGNVHFNWGSQTASGTGSTVLVEDLAADSVTAFGSPVLDRAIAYQHGTEATSFTLTKNTWHNGIKDINSASAVTATIPPHASVPMMTGVNIRFRQTGAGTVTVAPGAGVTLQSALGLRTRAQYSVINLQKTAINTWAVWGDTQV